MNNIFKYTLFWDKPLGRLNNRKKDVIQKIKNSNTNSLKIRSLDKYIWYLNAVVCSKNVERFHRFDI